MNDNYNKNNEKKYNLKKNVLNNDMEEKNNINLNVIPIKNNLKVNNDLVLKKQNIIKRNKTNSKKSLLIIENDNKQIIKNIKRDKINGQNTKEIFKNEKFDIFKNVNQNKKIGLNSCENKEFEHSNLNNKN